MQGLFTQRNAFRKNKDIHLAGRAYLHKARGIRGAKETEKGLNK